MPVSRDSPVDAEPMPVSGGGRSIPWSTAGLAGLLASVSVFGVWLGEGDSRRHAVALSVTVASIIAWIELAERKPRTVHMVEGNRRSVSPTYTASILLGILLVSVTGMARSATEWSSVDSVRLGPYKGEATVIGDSKEVGRGRRVVLEIDGQRFESWVFGSKRHRVHGLESGEVIAVEGVRREFESRQARRSQIRHVLGRFDISQMASVIDSHRRSSPVERAANRVRGMIRKGAEVLEPERSALFTGLVYGDDSSQPPEMTANFRASGLAHLTAVSGQNVVYLLAMAGPVLARTRRPVRIGCTVVLLVWFAIMTRLEPSVVRAVFMAGTSTLLAGIGGPVSSWVALCATVGVASLVDPFLVWSVGWWLSVAGCAGLIVATPPITQLFVRFPPWLSSWVAPTIAAQTGVLGVIVGVFGWPSAMSVPCNLLAAPVAGLVMLIGLPTAIVSGLLPESLGHIVMWPVGWGVAWVEAIAAVGARIDPPDVVDVVVSLALVCFTAWAAMRFQRTRVDFTPGVSSAISPL